MNYKLRMMTRDKRRPISYYKIRTKGSISSFILFSLVVMSRLKATRFRDERDATP